MCLQSLFGDLPLPKLINLLTDPKEERDVAAKSSWVLDPVMKILDEFEANLKQDRPSRWARPIHTSRRNGEDTVARAEAGGEAFGGFVG